MISNKNVNALPNDKILILIFNALSTPIQICNGDPMSGVEHHEERNRRRGVLGLKAWPEGNPRSYSLRRRSQSVRRRLA
jgi:hypothetical protein